MIQPKQDALMCSSVLQDLISSDSERASMQSLKLRNPEQRTAAKQFHTLESQSAHMLKNDLMFTKYYIPTIYELNEL